MSLRALIFMAWCALLLVGMALAAYFAWSPYADTHHGGRHAGYGGHGGYGYGAYYGPMHK